LEVLKSELKEIENKISTYQSELKNFKLDKTSLSVKKDLADTNTFSEMLMSVTGYSTKSILSVYGSDSSIIQASKKKIEILEKTKIKKMKKLANLQFADTYDPGRVLFIPPGCPDSSCPFYKTHPSLLKKKNFDDFKDEVKKLRREIAQIELEIEVYSGYPL
jgi:uncharacterized protein YbcI